MKAFNLQTVVGLGLNLTLSFLSNAWSSRVDDRQTTTEFVDFNREPNKVCAYYYYYYYYYGMHV